MTCGWAACGGFALHSPTTDPGEGGVGWAGEAKLSGRVEAVTDPARVAAVTGGEPSPDGERTHLFRCDLDEVVHTGLSDPIEHLVILLWRPGRGLRTFTR